jgi:hypothetical protein
VAQIGIKLADHSFYPVLEDDSPRRKRMVLTVAREGQHSVQVDLLRRSEEGDQLVGCLVLEDLPEEKDMELEFVLGLDGSGNIDARISDVSGSQYQSLAANLAQLDEPSAFGLPEESSDVSDVADISGLESLDEAPLDDDFTLDMDMDLDLDTDLDLPEELEGEGTLHASISGSLSEDDLQDYDDDGVDTAWEERSTDSSDGARPFNLIVLVALVLIVLGVAMVGAYLFFGLFRGDALPEIPGSAAVLSSSVIFFPG